MFIARHWAAAFHKLGFTGAQQTNQYQSLLYYVGVTHILHWSHSYIGANGTELLDRRDLNLLHKLNFHI